MAQARLPLRRFVFPQRVEARRITRDAPPSHEPHGARWPVQIDRNGIIGFSRLGLLDQPQAHRLGSLLTVGDIQVIAEVRDLAREYTTLSLETLAAIAKSGKSESARVAAATALLDRGYGKPTQLIGGDGTADPIEYRTLTVEEMRLRAVAEIEAAFEEMKALPEVEVAVDRPHLVQEG